MNVALKKYNLRDNPEGHLLINKIINLALLPPNLIASGLDIIIAEVNKKFENNQPMLKNWKTFFKYFDKQWMQSVKPEYFSVYECVDRTNNYIESYHRYLNSILGGRKTAAEFLSNICLLVYVRILGYDQTQ